MARFVPNFVRQSLQRYVWTRGPARLLHLSEAASCWTMDPIELVATITSAGEAAKYVAEGAARGVAAPAALRYPAGYASEVVTLRALFALTRALRPTRVLETGVADGASTRVITDALALNGRGHLVSVDVNPDLADTIGDKAQWTYCCTDGSLAAFERVLDGVGELDLFIHDSDHTYRHQMGEFKAAWTHLRPGGVLVADDVDWSNAMLDFCAAMTVPMHGLVTTRRVFGLCQKPGGRQDRPPQLPVRT